MLLVVWGDKTFLVCVLWVNISHWQGVLLVLCKKNILIVVDHRCMSFIQIRHNQFGWEVWDYILPWCLQGWPTQGSKHIHSHFCCWRVWWDKSLINQCKWNKHHFCKWRCLKGSWLWWYQQLVCRLLFFDLLDFRLRWIVHGKYLLSVVEILRRCEGWLVSCSLVIGLYK